MARQQARGDEEELDPVEAADEIDEDDEGLDGFSDVEVEAEDVVDGEIDDVDDAEIEDFDDDLDDDGDSYDDEDDEVLGLPAVAADDEIDLGLEEELDLVEAVAEVEEDDDDALRDGEFVCQSCFMAKRESALADPKRMLCRDCA